MRRAAKFLIRSTDATAPIVRLRENRTDHVYTATMPPEPCDMEQHITEHFALAKWALRKWGRRLISLVGYAEAEQIARIALLHSMRRFDPSRGSKFSTYAVWWLRAYIYRAVAREIRNRKTTQCTSLDARNDERMRSLLDFLTITEAARHPAEIKELADFARAWFLSKGRAGEIAYDFLSSGDTLETVGERHGCTREYVRQCKEKWAARARAVLPMQLGLRLEDMQQ